jgi:predicted anti-sigma-YlaC factor YlaD
VRCEAVAARLPALLDDEEALAPAQARHLGGCLHCQAELARYRRLRRMLGAMAGERAPVPPGAPSELLAALDAGHEPAGPARASGGRRAAYLGTIAAATAAAGVGGAWVLARRRPA